MRNIIQLILVLLNLSFIIFNIKASDDFEYNVIRQDKHIIHVLKIDPKIYRLELIKAHNQVFGRETVEELAKRKNALAAINAGFFEIGGNQDGRPSASLITEGKIIRLVEKLQNLLIIRDNECEIVRATPKILLKIGNKTIPNVLFNEFSKPNSTSIYNEFWGVSTITPYYHNEYIVTNNGKVSNIASYGDNVIPKDSFVISSAINDQSLIQIDDQIKIEITLIDTHNNELPLPVNMVTGIPQLVKNSKVDNLEKSDKTPTARTALGIRGDGKIIILVAEHTPKQDIRKINLAQVQDILKKQKNLEIQNVNIVEIKKIIEQTLQKEQDVVGLNLIELAELMIKLGCVEAINLDGGGSSTMLLNNRVVNLISDDEDENIHVNNGSRPVSDAILIFKK